MKKSRTLLAILGAYNIIFFKYLSRFPGLHFLGTGTLCSIFLAISVTSQELACPIALLVSAAGRDRTDIAVESIAALPSGPSVAIYITVRVGWVLFVARFALIVIFSGPGASARRARGVVVNFLHLHLVITASEESDLGARRGRDDARADL